jgi:hypothetical protein
LDIINFCDAAGEWGSILPIPAHEAKRMVELADRRKIADLDESHRPPPRFDDREELQDRMQSHFAETEGSQYHRHSRFGDMEELQDRKQPRFEPRSLPHDMGRPLQEPRQPEREDRYRLHNAETWRGNEYLLPEERPLPEDAWRRRRVSFADERPYFEVGGMCSDGACTIADLSRSDAVEKKRLRREPQKIKRQQIQTRVNIPGLRVSQ